MLKVWEYIKPLSATLHENHPNTVFSGPHLDISRSDNPRIVFKIVKQTKWSNTNFLTNIFWGLAVQIMLNIRFLDLYNIMFKYIQTYFRNRVVFTPQNF